MATKKKVNKYYSSTLEWRDFEFFLCDKEKQEKTVQLLTERAFLLESGEPNTEKVIENAIFFANQLTERISKSNRSRNFGLANIAENVQKLSSESDQTGLYYYIAYLYGSVFWRMPYNLQRLPAAPAALSMFLDRFAETFIANMLNYTETEEDSEHEQND